MTCSVSSFKRGLPLWWADTRKGLGWMLAVIVGVVFFFGVPAYYLGLAVLTLGWVSMPEGMQLPPLNMLAATSSSFDLAANAGMPCVVVLGLAGGMVWLALADICARGQVADRLTVQPSAE